MALAFRHDAWFLTLVAIEIGRYETDMFQTADAFSKALHDLPEGDVAAAVAAAARQRTLTKPPGALGRLETLAEFLASWSPTGTPRADHVRLEVFAGNHGVVAQGVSPYPSAVTAQMVANFSAGGAAVNQLTDIFGIELSVTPIHLDRPTGDVTTGVAMTQAETLEAINAGAASLDASRPDVMALGEMGIGNTTIAALLSALAVGGTGRQWAGPGTGLDTEGVNQKAAAIDHALALHSPALRHVPGEHVAFDMLRRAGGRETAAIAGAILAARQARIPVLIDGYVVTAALAALWVQTPTITAHCIAAHRSSEPAHGMLLNVLDLHPLLELEMRLGEGSGAALAVPILRAAVATHNEMATFEEAAVSGRETA